MKESTNIRKQEIYGNWKVFSINGDLLFLCLEDRANWYLNRNLAIQKTIDPPSIQLTFITKKESNKDDSYYLSAKKNQCVKCGTEILDQLTKHHIVPQMYRKHLPEAAKSRNSFDILPMCFEHHEQYERYADLLKLKLASQYNAPINGIFLLQNKPLRDAINVSSAACAILHHGDKMSFDRKNKLLQYIRDFLNKVDILDEDIENTALIYTHSKNNMKTHGEIVMEQILDYQEFVEMWRYHFLEYVKPEFMPNNWDPKRPIIRI